MSKKTLNLLKRHRRKRKRNDRIESFNFRKEKGASAEDARHEKGESNLDGFIRQALLDGKEVYIPVCLPERQMEAGRLIDMEHFEKGPLGLRNLPAGYEVTSPESLDLVLIPGLAVSQEGIRLGMGAGYYDRYLARVPFEKRVAALWDFQVIPDIPSEPFDQKIAKIVTDKSVIVTKRG